MNELFGVSMNVIMVIVASLFAVCILIFAATYASNRMMFKMGLRNVRRRRAQSFLVVSGLMLATVIITAAFGTGDTVDYSVTKLAYDNLQRTDLSIHHFRSTSTAPGDADTLREQSYVPEEVTAGLEATFADDADIEGFMPFLFEAVPVLNPRTRLTEPLVFFAGYDQARLDRFGGLELASGERADLAALAEDEVLVGEELADAVEARVGDEIEVYAGGDPVRLRVAGIVRDERSSGQLEFGPVQPPNMAAHLATVQRLVGRVGEINSISVVLRGDVRSSLPRTDAAAERLEALATDEPAKQQVGLGGLTFQVETNKLDTVEEAEMMGNIFVTMFALMGLFSIAAGTMLIFTLFVMMAAERRTEMGIARAVGAQRINLVQSFLAEGVVYDLLAGAIGVVLGVAAAFLLVLLGVRFLIGEQLDFITPRVTTRSLVVSFCLGTVLTFLTVVVSSYRVSYLNIVAAVRGQADSRATETRRGGVRWNWVVLGVPFLLLLPPLGLYWVLRKGLGLPWPRVLIPGGFGLVALLILLGLTSRLAFPYLLGVSLTILTIGAVALNLGKNPRVVWTIVGTALGLYWLVPNDWERDILGEMEGNVDLFVLSGVMIVLSFTLVIVHNARLLSAVAARGKGNRYSVAGKLGGVTAAAVLAGVAMGDRIGGLGQLFYLVAVCMALFAVLALLAARIPRLAPALKMGVAYPLANRFRTGMTIAMFSLVIFSITMMGIINASILKMFSTDEAKGGWDIQVATNPNNPVDDLAAELRTEGSFDPSVITGSGKVTQYDDNSQQARVPGESQWESFPTIAGDDTFYSASRMELEGRATGYPDAQAVFDAVRTQLDLAVVDSSVIQEPGMGGLPLHIDLTVRDGEFEPFSLEVRDSVTGISRTVTVVGILSSRIPANILTGVYVNADTYRRLYGEPDYRDWYLRLDDGIDSEAAAKDIKAALVTHGVEATSIDEMIDEMLATSRGFIRILQAFMSLGLLVGIASLGVIALRSVVERRQQIGMLRAIGYQRGTVALSFVLESGFVAMMGIVSGVVGATILSWNLLRSDAFASTSKITFFVPWGEIISYSLVAFAFALLMTWWPSTRASSVPVAEALRYE